MYNNGCVGIGRQVPLRMGWFLSCKFKSCHLYIISDFLIYAFFRGKCLFYINIKMNNNMDNNNLNFENPYLSKVSWFTLNKKGLINDSISLKNKAAVYIFQHIENKSEIYIGSTYNINQRIKQHRYSVKNGHRTCPKFYNYIEKYGWDNFRLGILEYINIYDLNKDKYEIKSVILDREQYYLNKINPSLNINKTAGSTLGYKHTEEMRKTMGLLRKGKSINGITVKVLDKHNVVINIFPTITSAAKHYNVDNRTLSKYIKEGYSLNNLRFEATFKDFRVWVFDKECNIIDVFTTANKAANFWGIYHTILHRYLRSGKIWKNKYYFSRTNSCI